MIRNFTLFIALIASFTANAQTTKVDSTSLIVNIEDVIVLSSFSKTFMNKPVVLSTITSKDIVKKLSNQEFPEVLKYTPSIYATKMGGGFGDSRITLRGFGSENISTLINGVPVNGMENGSIYWSNWAGLADVAHSIQVQRGIGLSKLGLFSVGGTINIITKGAEAQKGGWVYYGVGNDGYQKMGLSASTGETANGWAFTMMGSRTIGDGYVDGTNFEAWSYFANLTKRINDRHSLAFTFFGAPQWHNRRANKHYIEDYDEKGLRMNTSYGYLNGKVLPTYSGYNEYHKPQLSLNHFWHIGNRASLTTSVYASMAKGGGRKVYGKDANFIQYNFKDGRPIYDKDGNMVSNLTADGLIDYGPLMEKNRDSKTGSSAVFTMGTNSHDWYGMLSNFTQPLGERFTLTAGVDVRYYKGFHYDEIENLLGGAYFTDNTLAWREKDTKLKVGDRVSQDYFSEIMWLGAFGQLEYNSEHIQTFVSASVTNHKYRRTDRGKYGEFGNQETYPKGDYRTSWRDFVPMSIKAGFNYLFTDEHRVFVNGGYITKAPMIDNIYTDNNFLINPVNEKITSFELGYNYTTEKVRVQLNGYITKWLDKSVTKPIGAWNGPKACIPNLDALHKGVELEVNYAPCKSLILTGFATYGDWRWTNDVNFTYIDENGVEKGTYKAYTKGLNVGNAPQTSAYLAASWECFSGFNVGADFNYYARHYADFSAIDRNKEEDRAQAWKLPDYATVDLNLNYKMEIGKRTSMTFFGNINNLFDKKYITDAVDGADHSREKALVWYGFGTTWTAGVRLNF